MKKVLQVLSFAALAALLGGCASYGHHNQAVAQANSDQVITANVSQAIAQDKRLKHANISATTANGVVTLSGVVSSKHARKHAIYLARTTSGVVAVDASNLKVAHHKAKAAHHAAKKPAAKAKASTATTGSKSTTSTGN